MAKGIPERELARDLVVALGLPADVLTSGISISLRPGEIPVATVRLVLLGDRIQAVRRVLLHYRFTVSKIDVEEEHAVQED